MSEPDDLHINMNTGDKIFILAMIIMILVVTWVGTTAAIKTYRRIERIEAMQPCGQVDH